jgi:hypothetical protein
MNQQQPDGRAAVKGHPAVDRITGDEFNDLPPVIKRKV